MAAINKLTKKVAIYVRVSTHWQIDKDSLQVQRRELTAYSEMILGIDNYEVFEDPGYSGKNVERPAFKEMMRRVRSGEFSHILVWKIDRVSRNLLDFASMYEELKSRGVTFISKNEQFDTSSAIGEAMLKIILIFAELERNMTAERVSATMLSRANNGQWNGGRVPYGYNYDKQTKEFSISETEGPIVKRIYELYESEQSTLQVARILNRDGQLTRNGSEWSTTQIHKVLSNPFYYGTYVYNVHKEGGGYKRKEEAEWIKIDNHHIPIVSKEKFDRVKFILGRKKRGGIPCGVSYQRKHVHIFAGLLRCNSCGENMSATSDRRRADGWRPSIYGCHKKRRKGVGCDNKYVSDATLGQFVFNYIANVIRAKETTTKNTSLITLERKLLRGDVFSDVAHIGEDGLKDTFDLFLAGTSGIEYKHKSKESSSNAAVEEIRELENQVRQNETALNRLKSLFLYAQDAMPEKDFVIERQRLIDDIEKAKQRLSELRSDSSISQEADDDFITRASYFVMTQKLLEDRYVNYENYVRKIDPVVPQNFLRSVFASIQIENGRVASMTFKNGITHTFKYRSSGT